MRALAIILAATALLAACDHDADYNDTNTIVVSNDGATVTNESTDCIRTDTGLNCQLPEPDQPQQ